MNHRMSILAAVLWFAVIIAVTIPSCTHDPFLPEDPMDTMPDDSIQNSIPCEEDVVYFEKQILPLLRTNCALSGCHDAESAEDNVVLESYQSVVSTADVQPFNLNDSEFYEVLVEDNEEKRMPPPPANRLTAEQINLIAEWILQGAENLNCDDTQNNECITEGISFSNDIKPVIDTYCRSCHSGPSPSGGINLDGYENLKVQAESGKLYGVISWATGFPQMPQGSSQLDDCTIKKIKSWIDDGVLNN